ncbi:MAG: IS66 family transposase [candidate division KSB1 bacterium]|nr:IS66 family transposase [candidate division KSB1 bacterium]MDZ7368132.1 IS66 family transposase [candidate division KSB1 bacterium]MDZ7405810.1 IS66 family transposase [candidate division KSB1 bacterium]
MRTLHSGQRRLAVGNRVGRRQTRKHASGRNPNHHPCIASASNFAVTRSSWPSPPCCDWVKASCALLNPLYEVRRSELLRASYLMADETPIRVLDSEQPGKRHGVEPFAHLKDVLSRIADYPHRRVAEFFSQSWKSATSI